MSPVEKPTQADERRLSDAEAQLAFALNLRGSGVPAGRWGWAADHGVWLLKLAREALAARRLAADQAARTTTTEGEVAADVREAVDGIDYAHGVLARVFEKRGRLRDGVLASAVNMAAHRLAAVKAILATLPATPAGGGDGQDRKFAFRDGQFVNRVSGEPIPPDEPVIIFRARDRHAHTLLAIYHGMAEDEHHKQAIRDRMDEFAAYERAHPERMKEPGITRHIRLNDAPTHPVAPRG